MSSSYAHGHSAFPSRYVQSPIRMGAAMRYNPYGGGAFNSGPPQKAFKYTYTSEPPSQLVIKVTHQGEKPVIYMHKYNYFMSLSMEEMYDLSYNMKHILDRMELWKGILMGTREFQPRNKKDLMMVAKCLSRAKQLEREDQMVMYYVPPVKGKKKAGCKNKRHTHKKQDEEDAEEVEAENEEGKEEEEEEVEREEEDEEFEKEEEIVVSPPALQSSHRCSFSSGEKTC